MHLIMTATMMYVIFADGKTINYKIINLTIGEALIPIV